MSIKIFKLTNNEEIIADHDKKDGDMLVLEKPARIALMPTQDNTGIAMALIPWIPYSEDKEVKIKPSHILIEVNPTDEIIRQYRKNFGSGLVTPPTDIIV